MNPQIDYIDMGTTEPNIPVFEFLDHKRNVPLYTWKYGRKIGITTLYSRGNGTPFGFAEESLVKDLDARIEKLRRVMA